MREYLLKAPAREGLPANDRYGILRDRIQNFLDLNSIFCDEKFQKCWELAFSEGAMCKKMRFAALVYDRQKLVAQDVNRSMAAQFGKERFCALDGSVCGRESLPHRADPSLGDCGHAAIWCLKKVFQAGYRPSDLPILDFYEQGFIPNGDPWFRPKPEYTCVSCENTFATFGLDKVCGVHEMQWKPLWTKDPFFASAGYALGEKKT